MIRLIRKNQRGAAAVEFALLGPVFLATIFGIIEGARLVWTRQALQQAAFIGARCLGLGTSQGCNSTSVAVSKTVAEARGIGVPVRSSYVTATASAASGVCPSAPSAMSTVRIAMPYRSAVAGFLPYRFSQITVTACYPKLT